MCACLSGHGPIPAPALAQLTLLLTSYVAPVSDAFRQGGGVPYTAYRPEFTGIMDALSRDSFDHFLVDVYLPLVPGLTERLRAGARAADIACGSGHALVVLARAFPASEFVGYDQDAEALARGRAEAESLGLANLRFETATWRTMWAIPSHRWLTP